MHETRHRLRLQVIRSRPAESQVQVHVCSAAAYITARGLADAERHKDYSHAVNLDLLR